MQERVNAVHEFMRYTYSSLTPRPWPELEPQHFYQLVLRALLPLTASHALYLPFAPKFRLADCAGAGLLAFATFGAILNPAR